MYDESRISRASEFRIISQILLVCVPVCAYACVSVCISVCVSVYMCGRSVCVYVCVSVCVSVCVHACLSRAKCCVALTAGVALTAMGRLLSGIWGFFSDRVYEAYTIDSLEMSQEQVTWAAVRNGIA